MPIRHRCEACKKLFSPDQFIDSKHKDAASRFKYDFSNKFLKPWHRSWGRYASGECGPIEREEIDEYILQFEKFHNLTGNE